MKRIWLTMGLASMCLGLTACGDGADGEAGNPSVAAEKGDTRNIADSLDQNSQFLAAAKAAGLDATLAGPGPYTVLVPDDAAFGKLPEGALASLMEPDSRAELTGVLTYHILPGVVLAEDIGKAIDNAKGKAVLATMGGGTLTATREDGKIVLTDAAGTKAIVTASDQQASNGVVHRLDTVLMPGDSQA